MSDHEHGHMPRHGISPDDVSPAMMAFLDQHESMVKGWVRSAVNDLRQHVMESHGGDVGACRSYCGPASMLVNIEKLDEAELGSVILTMLHLQLQDDPGVADVTDV